MATDPFAPIVIGDRKFIIGSEIGRGAFCSVHEIASDEKAATSQRHIIKYFHYGHQFHRTLKIHEILSHASAEDRARIEQIDRCGVQFAAGVQLVIEKGPRFVQIPYVIMPRYEIRLKDFIDKYAADHNQCPPALVVLTLAYQMFGALDCLSRHNIVHGDVKPSNIMLRCEPSFDEDEVREFSAVLCDFGSARVVDAKTGLCKPATVGTLPYISPEVLIGLPYGPNADTWSMMLTIFYTIVGNDLLDVFDSYSLNYGQLDMVGLRCDDGTSADATESWPSVQSFATRTQDSDERVNSDIEFPLIYAHLVLLFYLIGKPPESFCVQFSQFYANGHPRYHKDLIPRSIAYFFKGNYSGLTQQQTDQIQTFLRRGLQYQATDRASARAIMNDQFLAQVRETKKTTH